MDIPDSSASALPGVLAALDVLDEADPHYAAHVRTTLLPQFDCLPADRTGLAQAAPTIQAYLALDVETRNRITSALVDLAARMNALRLDLTAALGGDAGRVRDGIRAAQSAQAADAFLRAMTVGATRTWSPANVRDAWMADTVEWVLEREPRVLVAAANGHVQRTPFSAPPYVPDPMTTLGGHLADRLGSEYVAIGTAFGHGEAWPHQPRPDDAPGHSHPFIQTLAPADPASADAAFAGAGIGDSLIDLRTATPGAAAGLDATAGLRNGDVLQPLPIRRAFDAIVYIDEVTPWHTWIGEKGLA
jgi:erythromycin esterase